MGKIKDLTGMRFPGSTLTVIRRAEAVAGDNRIRWVCKCDCGEERIVTTSNLPKTKSCGCMSPKRKKRPLDLHKRRYEAPPKGTHTPGVLIPTKDDRPAHGQIVNARVLGASANALPIIDMCKYMAGKTDPWWSMTQGRAYPLWMVTHWAPTPDVDFVDEEAETTDG